jgi:Ca-activated chloride channel family protein
MYKMRFKAGAGDAGHGDLFGISMLTRVSHQARHTFRLTAALTLLAAAGVLGLSLAEYGQAQDREASDVHILPRSNATELRGASDVNPALNIHTKPLKVEVDLVLIPATVTDPLNRLVTGLEKDNFIVFENG